jgi:hypothetical protein
MFVKIENMHDVTDVNAPYGLIQIKNICFIGQHLSDSTYALSLVNGHTFLTDQEGYDKILKIIDVEE